MCAWFLYPFSPFHNVKFCMLRHAFCLPWTTFLSICYLFRVTTYTPHTGWAPAISQKRKIDALCNFAPRLLVWSAAAKKTLFPLFSSRLQHQLLEDIFCRKHHRDRPLAADNQRKKESVERIHTESESLWKWGEMATIYYTCYLNPF